MSGHPQGETDSLFLFSEPLCPSIQTNLKFSYHRKTLALSWFNGSSADISEGGLMK
jgi:hypothetical protein